MNENRIEQTQKTSKKQQFYEGLTAAFKLTTWTVAKTLSILVMLLLILINNVCIVLESNGIIFPDSIKIINMLITFFCCTMVLIFVLRYIFYILMSEIFINPSSVDENNTEHPEQKEPYKLIGKLTGGVLLILLFVIVYIWTIWGFIS